MPTRLPVLAIVAAAGLAAATLYCAVPASGQDSAPARQQPGILNQGWNALRGAVGGDSRSANSANSNSANASSNQGANRSASGGGYSTASDEGANASYVPATAFASDDDSPPASNAAPPRRSDASNPPAAPRAPQANIAAGEGSAELTISDSHVSPPAAAPVAPVPPVPRQPVMAVADDDDSGPIQPPAPRNTRTLQQRLTALRQADEPQPVPVASDVDTSADVPPPPLPRSGPSSRRTAAPLPINSGDAQINSDAPIPAKPLPDDAAVPAPAGSDPDSAGSSGLKPVFQPAPAHRLAAPAPDSDATADETPPPAPGGGQFDRQSPVLGVETSGPRIIVIGKEANYKVTIKNSGDVAAQEVIVSVKIPQWTDVVGSQSTTGTARIPTAESGEPLQWRIPRLDAHGKQTLALRLVPRKGKAFDLGVQWTFAPVGSQTLVNVQEPKLAMSVAGPDEVFYGQSKIYRLTLTNPGTGDAENVVIHLSPVANPRGTPTHHPMGSLKAGESRTVELELTARQGGTVSIHAAATAEPSLHCEATQDVLVRRPAVAVAIDGAKVKYAGAVGTYTIQISNPGNATADHIRVVAQLPPDAHFASASDGGQYKTQQRRVSWSLRPLRPGDQAALELKCTLMAPGPNRLQVSSAAAGDASDTANFTTRVEALADLKLDVAEPAGPIAVGDEVIYELRVRNRGSKGAEGVGIVAYFSDGIEPVGANGGPHDISNGVVAYRPLPALGVGEEVVYKIRARAQQSGKQVFRAEVECGALGTKLVSAEETMIYAADDALGPQHVDRAMARRPEPLPQTIPQQTAPLEGAEPSSAGVRR